MVFVAALSQALKRIENRSRRQRLLRPDQDKQSSSRTCCALPPCAITVLLYRCDYSLAIRHPGAAFDSDSGAWGGDPDATTAA